MIIYCDAHLENPVQLEEPFVVTGITCAGPNDRAGSNDDDRHQ